MGSENETVGEGTLVPFTAETRMSGIDLGRSFDPEGRRRRDPGSGSRTAAGSVPAELDAIVERIATSRRDAAGRGPATPHALGVIHLKDIVKEGMRERFAESSGGWGSAR